MTRQVEPGHPIKTHVSVFVSDIENYSAASVIEHPTIETNRPKTHISGSLAISALFYCFAITLWGTSVVVVRTPGDVSIATDSAAMYFDPLTRVLKPSGSVCKIYRSDTTIMGAAGYIGNSNTNFYVPKIVFEAIRGKRDFPAKMDAAEVAVKSRLLTQAVSMKRYRPEEFNTLVDPKKGGGLSIVLLGLNPAPAGRSPKYTTERGKTQAGIPFAVVRSFIISETPARGTEVTLGSRDECPGKACPDGSYIFALGDSDAIDVYFSNSPVNNGTNADFAMRLVQIEIDAHALGVGPPIDVLRVTPSNEKWIKQKSGCPIEFE
jgi:hypothetical protein